MKKLISFTIKSEFGMFKKPDINDKIFITYNTIHKPYILGILGAIVGYDGYAQRNDKNKIAEYYDKLQNIGVAIAPYGKKNGLFQKEFIVFNNTTNGTTSNITEQTIINPAYRIYIELDEKNKEHRKIINNLQNNKAVYLPYMGKNEFSLWWEDFHIHEKFEKIEKKEKFEVKSIIKKGESFILKGTGYKERTTNYFYLFERLPIGFDDELKQYIYADFVFTNHIFKTNNGLNNLYECDEGIICLF